ncbi:MAG: glycosyltransferase [Actinomycetota bacterium]
MTKVLLLCNSLRSGGAERTLLDLIRQLSEQDFDLDLECLCLHEEGEWFDGLAEVIPTSCLRLPPRIRVAELIKLRKAIDVCQPTILQTFHRGANRWGAVAGRATGVPVIVNSLQNVYRGNGRLGRGFDRLGLRFATHGVACSDSVRRFYIEDCRVPAHKLTTIHNSVDLSRFSPVRAATGRSDEAFSGSTLICVASLTEQKGLSVLLEALSLLPEGTKDFRLLLVGEGPLRSDLERQASRLGLADRVHFLGMREDVPDLLVASTVFVLPSLWEGLGVAALEAMAASLPVVASSVDGLREVVEDGVTGILVPPGDGRLLSSALEKVLGDNALRDRMGRAGRERVARMFSAPAMAAAYQGLWERLALAS